MCCGSAILFYGWLITVIVLQRTDIKPCEITDRSMTLTKVSARFVIAVESIRALRRDEPDAHLRYDDVRYDYDDDRRPTRVG